MIRRLLTRRWWLLLGALGGYLVLQVLWALWGGAALAAAARAKQAAAEKARGEAASTEAEVARWRAKVEIYRSSLPAMEKLEDEILQTQAQRFPRVQQEVAALAEAHHLPSREVRYSLEEDNRYYRRLVLNLPLRGGYGDVKNYLKAVGASPQFLVVEDLSLAGQSGGGALVEVDLRLVTWFKAEGKPR